jgi:beta-galactosidase
MITQLGLTKRTFEMPNWNGRHVFLHFEGGTSAMYIWINGEKVGYSQNTKVQQNLISLNM